MKYIKTISILIILGLSSCNNDLDITHFADPTPVVYGMICPKDSVHQIRFSKSFICEGEVQKFANIPDSIYYPEAQVFLEARNPDGDILQRRELLLVNGTDKDPGFFVSNPNPLYQCISTQLIRPESPSITNLRYTLTIHLPDRGLSILAESLVPPLPSHLVPPIHKLPFPMELYDQIEPLKISWKRSMDFYIQLKTIINYTELINEEWKPAFITHTRKFNHWDIQPVYPFEEVPIDGDWFFTVVKNRITINPNVESRKFISVDFQLIISDPLFYDFMLYDNFQSDLTTNTFTNVINGIGIFAAYNKADWKGYTLSQKSLDSLAKGEYTKHLKFTNKH